MKHILICFLLIALSAVLASCSRGEDPEFFTLNVSADDNGYVIVAGEDLGSTGENSEVKIEAGDEKVFEGLEKDSMVELQAFPDTDEGYEFGSWQVNNEIKYGDEEDYNSISLLITDNKKVEAGFGHQDSVIISGSLDFNHSFPFSPLDEGFHDLEPAALDQSELLQDDGEKMTARESRLEKEKREPEEIIVGLERDIKLESEAEKLAAEGLETVDRSKSGHYLLVQIPAGSEDDIDELLQRLESRASVRYAEPNRRMQLLDVEYPDDPHFGYQWHYPQIRLPQVWSDIRGSSSVRVAVIDTGVNKSHPDLAGQIAEEDGYNFADDSEDFSDVSGHGTHVAGTIAASTDNSRGVAGVKWDSSLVPLKVTSNDTAAWSDIADAIRYAAGLTEDSEDPQISSPVDIINISLGGPEGNSVKEAIEEAHEEGIIIVAAAGNTGDNYNEHLYPAAYDEVLSVGAVNYNYPYEPDLAEYSHYSEELDVLAPGGDMDMDSDDSGREDGVLSTYSIDDESFGYRFMSGTSMAAPHVSGVIGLMLAEEPGLDLEEVREIFSATSMELAGIDEDIGEAGLINAYWALHRPQDIKVELLREEDDDFQLYEEKTVSLRPEREFEFSGLPRGRYRLRAGLDIQNTGSIDAGDYSGESDTFQMGAEESREIEFQLQETY